MSFVGSSEALLPDILMKARRRLVAGHGAQITNLDGTEYDHLDESKSCLYVMQLSVMLIGHCSYSSTRLAT